MPITTRANGGPWIDVLFSDPYTREESEQVMKAIFAQPGLARPLRFLVDVRQSTPPDAEFVVNAITFWQLHVSDMWGARVAILTASEGQAEMAELSEHYAQWRELPFTLRRFGKDDEGVATDWLQERT